MPHIETDLLKALLTLCDGQIELEIRLQRIVEALADIDLTLQAIVAYND